MVFLALSSPLVNPFIYFLMWKRYRQALVQMAETMTCRHHRGEWKDKRIDFGGNYTLSEAIESLSGRFVQMPFEKLYPQKFQLHSKQDPLTS